MDYFIILRMGATKKRDGFEGQRAIVIPAKILPGIVIHIPL